MTMPSDVAVIDTMIGFPHGDMKATYKFITDQTEDRSPRRTSSSRPSTCSRTCPTRPAGRRRPDRADPRRDGPWGIEQGLVGVRPTEENQVSGRSSGYPDRFIASARRTPTRHGRRARHRAAARRATASAPSAASRPAPSRRSRSTTSRCTRSTPTASSSASPIFVLRRRPRPAPAASRRSSVELIDEVCYDFPELIFVTRHGCEPWEDLAVKLMLKWPNLYYSTCAFAPKYYPKAIVDYANTRGADKIIYAGYFPMGLSLERIFTELPRRAVHDDVWPKFLRRNAARVLGLDTWPASPYVRAQRFGTAKTRPVLLLSA